ncbi:MAG: TAXI family TRAP transporter solute-binding subunit [Syntrophomonadaceae bacterium]|jgi:TRAP transporter TAXI family solute receptor
MKRNWRIIGLITLMMFMAGMVFGCSGDSSSKDPSGGQQAGGDKTQLITIGTATVGGAWYPMGGALANVISNYVPNTKANATPTAATIENLSSLKAKTMEIGMCTADVPYKVYRGIGGMEKDENLRALVMTDPTLVGIIVKENSPYKKFTDLKGKRMGTGVAGSATYFIVEEILKAHDMTYDDVQPYQGGNAQQATALKDGNIDAFIMTIPKGGASPAVIELDTTCDIRFIPLDKEILQKINAEHPYYVVSEFPVGYIDGMTEPAPTLEIGTVMAIRADLSDDLVYQICKAMFEHKDELDAIQPQWKRTDKETAALNVPIPLHPGAEKYYNENGFAITLLP